MIIYCVDLECDGTTRFIFSKREDAEACVKELGEEDFYIDVMELDFYLQIPKKN